MYCCYLYRALKFCGYRLINSCHHNQSNKLEEARVFLSVITAERHDDSDWDALMANASAIAEVYNIAPSIPRTTERQQHRNDADADSTSAHLHMTVTNWKAHWLLWSLYTIKYCFSLANSLYFFISAIIIIIIIIMFYSARIEVYIGF